MIYFDRIIYILEKKQGMERTQYRIDELDEYGNIVPTYRHQEDTSLPSYLGRRRSSTVANVANDIDKLNALFHAKLKVEKRSNSLDLSGDPYFQDGNDALPPYEGNNNYLFEDRCNKKYKNYKRDTTLFGNFVQCIDKPVRRSRSQSMIHFDWAKQIPETEESSLINNQPSTLDDTNQANEKNRTVLLRNRTTSCSRTFEINSKASLQAKSKFGSPLKSTSRSYHSMPSIPSNGDHKDKQSNINRPRILPRRNTLPARNEYFILPDLAKSSNNTSIIFSGNAVGVSQSTQVNDVRAKRFNSVKAEVPLQSQKLSSSEKVMYANKNSVTRSKSIDEGCKTRSKSLNDEDGKTCSTSLNSYFSMEDHYCNNDDKNNDNNDDSNDKKNKNNSNSGHHHALDRWKMVKREIKVKEKMWNNNCFRVDKPKELKPLRRRSSSSSTGIAEEFVASEATTMNLSVDSSPEFKQVLDRFADYSET